LKNWADVCDVERGRAPDQDRAHGLPRPRPVRDHDRDPDPDRHNDHDHDRDRDRVSDRTGDGTSVSGSNLIIETTLSLLCRKTA